MAKFCSLYSSSSGNCTYIGTSKGGILIDIGVSAKRTCEALNSIGVDPSSISAIFITHEHTDHISGVKVFAKKYGTTVYATEGTLLGMEEKDVLDPVIRTAVVPFTGIEAGGIWVRPFSTPHDSRESCGYSAVTPDGRRISVATDIGRMTDTVMNAILGSDLVLLESNHDVGMLQNGPYNFHLKQRILSPIGHLSNESCAKAAVKLFESGTTRLVLGHLSKENNIPSLAYETTRSAMTLAGATEGRDYLLTVAGDLNPVIAF